MTNLRHVYRFIAPNIWLTYSKIHNARVLQNQGYSNHFIFVVFSIIKGNTCKMKMKKLTMLKLFPISSKDVNTPDLILIHYLVHFYCTYSSNFKANISNFHILLRKKNLNGSMFWFFLITFLEPFNINMYLSLGFDLWLEQIAFYAAVKDDRTHKTLVSIKYQLCILIPQVLTYF